MMPCYHALSLQLFEWWNQVAYLGFRYPVVVHSSPGIGFPLMEAKDVHQFTRYDSHSTALLCRYPKLCQHVHVHCMHVRTCSSIFGNFQVLHVNQGNLFCKSIININTVYVRMRARKDTNIHVCIILCSKPSPYVIKTLQSPRTCILLCYTNAALLAYVYMYVYFYSVYCRLAAKMILCVLKWNLLIQQ